MTKSGKLCPPLIANEHNGAAQWLESFISPGAHRIRKLSLTSFFVLRATLQTYLSAKVYSVTYPSWRVLSPLPLCLLDASPASLMLSRKGTHDRQIKVFK